jgi:pyruvate,water dikinase
MSSRTEGPGRVGAISAGVAGAKAARLSAALDAGFPVLPGWVVPSAESRPAVRAGAAAVRAGHPEAGRRAALSCPPDPVLAAELREAVSRLGGRVIVRSSSPLESDPRWSGAFSSVAEVGPEDAATAVRSCWAAAFAVDPLARLESSGLVLDALELGILIQPELRPTAGGVARVTPATGTDSPARMTPAAGIGRCAQLSAVDVVVDGVEGHPGPLLSGWADGASARVRVPSGTEYPPARPVPATAEGPLADRLGGDIVTTVARLAEGIYRILGDATIEWAVTDGKVWLLQSQSAHQALALDAVTVTASLGSGLSAAEAPGRIYAARESMPLLAAAVQARGHHVLGRPAAAGTAAGRLVVCRPHERRPDDCRDAILLVERPVPALAPLLFGARGVIARAGAAGSHLAEVARSLAVPMVTGCHPETVTGSRSPGAPWLAAIDGTTGEVALLPG